MMTAARLLELAADTVERAWRQDGTVEAGDPRRCAVTACSDHCRPWTLSMQREWNRALMALGREIGIYDPREMTLIHHIAMYNDTPGRRKEEVAATMRNAKRHLEEP